jgi:ABC-type polysaccharide/polyol phosphate export permease
MLVDRTAQALHPIRLALNVARFDLHAQRKETLLGLVWLFLWPLLQAGGLLIAFQAIRGGPGMPAADAMVATYCGVLIWATASGVLIASLNLLKAHREIITQIVFPVPALAIADVCTKYVFFLLQLVVALAAWLVVVPGAQPAALFSVLLYLAAFALSLLAMAWVMSIVGLALPDLSYVLPPVLMLLLALSPIFQPASTVLPPAVQLVNAVNPFAWWVQNFYAATGMHGTEAGTPWGFLLSSLVLVVGAWLLTRPFYREAVKVL